MIRDKFTGLLFKVKDELSLKVSMLSCEKLEELSKSLGKNARMDFDARYNYEEMVEAYLRIISM
jgi:hypothetical protein